MTEHNINESTINEDVEAKRASDEAAAEAHEPTHEVEGAARADDRITPEKVGDAAVKLATEAAYAAAGFAGLVGEKAKAFYDEQRTQYAKAHPDEDPDSAKAFLGQLSEQLSRLADDLTRGYRDLAQKGRVVVSRDTPGAAQSPVNDGDESVTEESTPFSSDLSEDVTPVDPATDQVLPDADRQDGIL